MEAEYSAETSAVHRISHSPSTQEHGQDRHWAAVKAQNWHLYGCVTWHIKYIRLICDWLKTERSGYIYWTNVRNLRIMCTRARRVPGSNQAGGPDCSLVSLDAFRFIAAICI
jgi:hypothetical protein